jgi:hypothetical protein
MKSAVARFILFDCAEVTIRLDHKFPRQSSHLQMRSVDASRIRVSGTWANPGIRAIRDAPLLKSPSPGLTVGQPPHPPRFGAAVRLLPHGLRPRFCGLLDNRLARLRPPLHRNTDRESLAIRHGAPGLHCRRVHSGSHIRCAVSIAAQYSVSKTTKAP